MRKGFECNSGPNTKRQTKKQPTVFPTASKSNSCLCHLPWRIRQGLQANLRDEQVPIPKQTKRQVKGMLIDSPVGLNLSIWLTKYGREDEDEWWKQQSKTTVAANRIRSATRTLKIFHVQTHKRIEDQFNRIPEKLWSDQFFKSWRGRYYPMIHMHVSYLEQERCAETPSHIISPVSQFTLQVPSSFFYSRFSPVKIRRNAFH